MEALKIKGRAKGGILTLEVPEEFEGRDLEIIILSHDEQIIRGEPIDDNEERINRLLSVIGTAKDLNKTFDKHEVYDQ